MMKFLPKLFLLNKYIILANLCLFILINIFSFIPINFRIDPVIIYSFFLPVSFILTIIEIIILIDTYHLKINIIKDALLKCDKRLLYALNILIVYSIFQIIFIDHYGNIDKILYSSNSELKNANLNEIKIYDRYAVSFIIFFIFPQICFIFSKKKIIESEKNNSKTSPNKA